METKKCTKCGVVKSVSDFGKKSSSSDGLQGRCKECRNADERDRGQDRSTRVRAPQPYDAAKEREKWTRKIAREAGMSVAEFEARRSKPCDVCRASDEPLSPYKAHGDTILGWICRKCNRALGIFEHDPDMVRAALKLLGG